MEKYKSGKIKNWSLLVAILFFIPSISLAVPVSNVKMTVHNLGLTSKISGPSFYDTTESTTEICIFCHTPHNAVPGQRFLWNRINSVNTFQLYTASATLNFAKGSLISDVSKMCMSCHDGATALNSMANPRAPLWTATIGDWFPLLDPNIPGEYGPNLGGNASSPAGGSDLTNDHPISFIYSESATNDPTIRAADVGGKTVGNGVLPLWNKGDGNYRVECVTCHDPHIYYGYRGGTRVQSTCDGIGDCSLKPFLRRSNSSSGLCFTCHNK